MKIGYARVSTGLQNLNLQEDRLNAYGCEKIFSDHISGSKSKRPGLDKAIEFAEIRRYDCCLETRQTRT
ncbi:DNA-invertase hin [Staphylococcus equorum]|nr:DNA-invertase hin [Staphylococcus equorum]